MRMSRDPNAGAILHPIVAVSGNGQTILFFGHFPPLPVFGVRIPRLIREVGICAVHGHFL